MRITETTIARLLKEERTDTYISFSGTMGLYLRIRGARATWYLITNSQGKRSRQLLGTYPEVGIEEAQLRAKACLSRSTKDLRLSALVELYFQHNPGKPGTLERKKRLAQRAIKLLHNPKLSMISPKDVDLLHLEIAQNAPIMANRVCEMLRAMLSLAVRWEYLDRNPASSFKRSKENNRIRKLSGQELARFLSALKEEKNRTAADILLILLLVGKRTSEIRCLKWSQVDIEGKRIHFRESKNEALSYLHLSNEVIEILKARKRISKWVFPSPVDSTKPINNLYKPFARICNRADIKNLTIHDLRRSFGSLLEEAGVDLLAIRDALDHKSIKTTERYLHLNRSRVNGALETAGAKISLALHNLQN